VGAQLKEPVEDMTLARVMVPALLPLAESSRGTLKPGEVAQVMRRGGLPGHSREEPAGPRPHMAGASAKVEGEEEFCMPVAAV
jgi:hypothetical protein